MDTSIPAPRAGSGAGRRKAAWELREARRQAAAAARREREADQGRATAARGTAAVPRPGRPPHDYRTCTDPACRRYACTAWKEAFQEGRASGLEDGYEQGYAAGLAAAR